MASKKGVATKSASSKSVRIARIAAVRRALTGYFLGSTAATEHFWNTANPSLGEKSPANFVKTGKLSKVEQYVSYLRKHTRSADPKFKDQHAEASVVAFEGTTEEVLERLKENHAAYRYHSRRVPECRVALHLRTCVSTDHRFTARDCATSGAQRTNALRPAPLLLYRGSAYQVVQTEKD